eukprot:gnl/MRDRNA2_/MRDRNA2_84433_c0_seq1.p1 gnl/MRDRNA2_/MRDRNA2_84433_c0~~gnl/MRDRNA2_/MRDRNA2_84433_c0_seq1.p1  ORF type:complete len:187 (+),score=22.68 gnl/MRDRNA2_/MRDRNA2_84433_c0_seq1:72-563(+)
MEANAHNVVARCCDENSFARIGAIADAARASRNGSFAPLSTAKALAVYARPCDVNSRSVFRADAAIACISGKFPNYKFDIAHAMFDIIFWSKCEIFARDAREIEASRGSSATSIVANDHAVPAKSIEVKLHDLTICAAEAYVVDNVTVDEMVQNNHYLFARSC